MASPTKFPLFAKLAPELRILTWEISILDYHRDRLVLIHEFTKRILCIRNLACSPHFHATWESRKVAMDLYPIRLPVTRMVAPRLYRRVEGDLSNDPHRGAVYISTDHDIFVFSFSKLALWDLAEQYYTMPPVGYFGWSLSQTQCQSMRRMMLFSMVNCSL
ncbi:hypothetical protein F4801DRAFT_551319 [Xylaria longipes]|nr:hypothetical protein F4801DRAFT_551319 [Xylaria longipes]